MELGMEYFFQLSNLIFLCWILDFFLMAVWGVFSVNRIFLGSNLKFH